MMTDPHPLTHALFQKFDDDNDDDDHGDNDNDYDRSTRTDPLTYACFKIMMAMMMMTTTMMVMMLADPHPLTHHLFQNVDANDNDDDLPTPTPLTHHTF